MIPSRLAVGRLAVVALVALHGIAALAGFFAPYSFREQHRSQPRSAPTSVRFHDRDLRLRLRPHVETAEGDLVPMRALVRGARYRVLGLFSSDVHLFGVDAPHRAFLLGTDALGRDRLSRLLYGAQISLTAGIVAAGLAVGLALGLGGLAGYLGGSIDGAVVWVGDVVMSLPWIYLLLAARAFLPLDLDPGAAFLVIVLILGLLGWVPTMRIVRSIVSGVRTRDYVAAARGAGAGHAHILARHVLPLTRGAMATQFALLVPGYILAEVTLSFVGLGVAEPVPSFGNLLAEIPGATGWISNPALLAPAMVLVLVSWLYHSLVSGPTER